MSFQNKGPVKTKFINGRVLREGGKNVGRRDKILAEYDGMMELKYSSFGKPFEVVRFSTLISMGKYIIKVLVRYR